MPNMNPKKNPMPSQDPAVRRRNFDEVALGYTEAMAIDEAERCKQSSGTGTHYDDLRASFHIIIYGRFVFIF